MHLPLNGHGLMMSHGTYGSVLGALARGARSHGTYGSVLGAYGFVLAALSHSHWHNSFVVGALSHGAYGSVLGTLGHGARSHGTYGFVVGALSHGARSHGTCLGLLVSVSLFPLLKLSREQGTPQPRTRHPTSRG